MLFDSFIERAFDVEVLHDCFDDQVAVLDLREIVIKISYGDE